MTDLSKRLGESVRKLRGTRSQRRFALEAGVEQATLSRIERGTENVTLQTLEKLCRALECDVRELFPPKRRAKR